MILNVRRGLFKRVMFGLAALALAIQPIYGPIARQANATDQTASGTLTMKVEPLAPEKVTISFFGAGSLDITDWKLYDLLASETLRHTFGEQTLAGDQAITLCSDGCDIQIASRIWNDTGDSAILRDAAGAEIIRVSYEAGALEASNSVQIGADLEPEPQPEIIETPVLSINGSTESGRYFGAERVGAAVSRENFRELVIEQKNQNGDYAHRHTYTVWNGTANLAWLGDGEYRAQAFNIAGNGSEAVTFTIDTTAPSVIDMTQKYEERENGRIAVTLTFDEAIDKNSLEQGWYEVAGSNGTQFVKRYYRTQDQSVEFRDLAGNVVVYEFAVDKTSPTVVLREGGVTKSSGSYFLTAKTIQVQPQGDDLGRLFINGKEYPQYYGRRFFDINWIVNQDKTIEEFVIVSEDQVGNRSDEYVVRVDRTAPTIEIKSGTGNRDGSIGSYPYYSQISFKLGDRESNLKEVELNGHIYNRNGRWNGLNWMNINKSHLVQGENTVIVRDQEGNQSELKFIYDTTSPRITIKDNFVGDLSSNTFSRVSFSLFDGYMADKYIINGHEVNFTNNRYSDANFQNIRHRLIEGENTIVLYDVAGNSSSYSFIYALAPEPEEEVEEEPGEIITTPAAPSQNTPTSPATIIGDQDDALAGQVDTFSALADQPQTQILNIDDEAASDDEDQAGEVLGAQTENSEISANSRDSEGEVLSDQDERNSWSIVNVALAGIILGFASMALAGAFSKQENRQIALRAFAAVLAIAAFSVVIWVEDFYGNISLVNIWTVLLAVIATVQGFIYSRLKTDE